jgi:uncharacterized protein YacL
MSLWVIRVLFLFLSTAAGFAISQVHPAFVALPHSALGGVAVGFGFGGLMIAIDEMLKGFSLRAFSAITFGLFLGLVVALIVDRSGLFADDSKDPSNDPTRRLVRISLFLGFGYIGMVLAMRSNKEDFSLIIPYVRFTRQAKADNLLLLDTSAIIDGRVADLIESSFLEGMIVVPRFVLKELQQIADSTDPVKRTRGRRGLEILNRIQRNQRNEVRIHDADFADEKDVDSKLIRLARNLNARIYTTDYNLGKVAELQSVSHVNLSEVARCLRVILLPGEMLSLRIVREGKERDQGVAYLPDGTMVVVNNAQACVGQQVEAQVQSTHQTGAGIIVFADLRATLSHNPGRPAKPDTATPQAKA